MPTPPPGVPPRAGIEPNPIKEEGAPEKDAIEKQLLALLNQAKKIAQSNGLNFDDILSKVSGNVSEARVPRPASMPAGQPQMGG